MICICDKCGRETNTAVSRWINSPDGHADGCFARVKIDDSGWEKGCSYEQGEDFEKLYADGLCGKNVNWQEKYRENILGNKMIRIKSKTGGMYFKLENDDWDGDYKGFFVAVKKLSTWVFNPVEMDEVNWWYIGKMEVSAVEEAYKEHIVKIKMAIMADELAGYVPMKRVSGKFVRRGLRY